MKSYTIQSVLDILDVKGLLTHRDEAEVSILCQLNQTQKSSIKKYFPSVLTLTIYLFIAGLIFFADYMSWIDLKLHRHQFYTAIACTLLSAFITIYSGNLKNTYFLASTVLSTMLMLSSAIILLLSGLSMGLLPFGVTAIAIVLAQYFWSNDELSKFCIGVITYYTLMHMPIFKETHYLFFAFITCICFFVCLLNDLNPKISPLIYASFFIIATESFYLFMSDSILPTVFYEHQFLILSFQGCLVALAMAHIIFLKRHVKPITSKLMWFTLGCLPLFSWHPLLTIGLIFMLIGYKYVSNVLIYCGLGLIIMTAICCLYALNVVLPQKLVLIITLGLVLALIKLPIKHLH